MSANTEPRRIAFVDLEASGFGSNGFPTELGWAIICDDGSVTSSSCLIKPPARWRLYENAWSPASERLTGITREMLEKDGLSPTEVMQRFIEVVGERRLYSDEPEFDAHWLGMLAEAAGIFRACEIGHVQTVIGKMCPKQRSELEIGRVTHRAEPDAQRLALAFAAALGRSR